MLINNIMMSTINMTKMKSNSCWFMTTLSKSKVMIPFLNGISNRFRSIRQRSRLYLCKALKINPKMLIPFWTLMRYKTLNWGRWRWLTQFNLLECSAWENIKNPSSETKRLKIRVQCHRTKLFLTYSLKMKIWRIVEETQKL